MPPKLCALDQRKDQDYIEQYKETGSLQILGELYDRYMHLVYGVALKYLKNREDARDVVTNIFEKLIDDLLKHEVDNFRSWLHVMTKNHCLMIIRAGKSKMKMEFEKNLEEDMEYAINPHHMDESAEEPPVNALNKCMKKLADEQQTCVRLFYLEEKSYKQVVDISGYELKKVKSYIQNGKRNLKICLEGNAA